MLRQEPFYRSYLMKELQSRCDRNPSYSMRAFAKSLGISPGVLSQILSGKTVPSYKRTQALLKTLNLDPVERERIFESVAELQKSRGLKRLNSSFRSHVQIKTVSQDLSIDHFKVISDWHHYAILMIAQTQNFKKDFKWMASQLSISELETKLAWERLVKLGFILEKNGKTKAKEDFTTQDRHLTTAALKRHQRQILEKAIFSLENDDISERDITSFTMAIDPIKLPQARDIIARATKELSTLLENGKRTRVYQLSISLFPIQKSQNQKEKS